MGRGQSTQANGLLFGARSRKGFTSVELGKAKLLLAKGEHQAALDLLFAALDILDHPNRKEAAGILSKAITSTLRPGNKAFDIDLSQGLLETTADTAAVIYPQSFGNKEIQYHFANLALEAYETMVGNDQVPMESLLEAAAHQFVEHIDGITFPEAVAMSNKDHLFLGRTSKFAVSKVDATELSDKVIEHMFQRGSLYTGSRTDRKPCFDEEFKKLLDFLDIGKTYTRNITMVQIGNERSYHVLENNQVACGLDREQGMWYPVKRGAWKENSKQQCLACSIVPEPEKFDSADWSAFTLQELQTVKQAMKPHVVKQIEAFSSKQSQEQRNKARTQIRKAQLQAGLELVADKMMQRTDQERWQSFGVESSKPISKTMVMDVLAKYKRLKNSSYHKNSYTAMCDYAIELNQRS